jgi:hypothetical protein
MLNQDATHDPSAMRQFEEMGELDYIAMRKAQALEYIKADYGRFAILCGKRFYYFWAGPPRDTHPWWLSPAKNSLFLVSSLLMFWGLGLALRRCISGSVLLLWLVLLYPTLYYFVYCIPRYRHPIEPEMAILCVFALTEATSNFRATYRDRSSGRESA